MGPQGGQGIGMGGGQHGPQPMGQQPLQQMLPQQQGEKALYGLQQMVSQQQQPQQRWKKQPAMARGAVRAISTRPRAAGVSNFFMVGFFLETRGERPRHPPDGGRAPMFLRNYTRCRGAGRPPARVFSTAPAAAVAQDTQNKSD
jgi:hypothetical protein